MSFDAVRISTKPLGGSLLRPFNFQSYSPKFKNLSLAGCAWKPNIPTLFPSFRIKPIRLNPRLSLGARYRQDEIAPKGVVAAHTPPSPMKTQKEEEKEQDLDPSASFDKFTPFTPRSGASYDARSESCEDKNQSDITTPPTTWSDDEETVFTSQASENPENRKIAVLELEDFLSIEAQRRERATLRRNQRDMCDEDKAGYKMRKHEQLLIIKRGGNEISLS